MPKSVFYSFHYQRDAFRVQQVINMGALERQTILNAQEWETVKRRGDTAIEDWIHKQMAYKSAVIVLVGAETSTRRWVRHEIAKAWDDRRPMIGVRIHGLSDARGTDTAGANPFEKVSLKSGGTVSNYVPLFSPQGSTSQAVYADIKNNLPTWVDSAYKRD
ncbi:TIR domain-containing protein [Rhodococcus qingshengii]|uniref:TIR domain-containing protein n=1 Tax=Rhodococcus qingshengii TaxID=334542 RepID=UPI0002B7C3F7|nr:TIR domain-containing protein [Rhodococcus qingshengii]EME14865.1 hypothetical protein G418_29497 [Rhodococcus qingshengii BKS 20-40]